VVLVLPGPIKAKFDRVMLNVIEPGPPKPGPPDRTNRYREARK